MCTRKENEVKLEWSFLILSLVMLNTIRKPPGSELDLQQCNWNGWITACNINSVTMNWVWNMPMSRRYAPAGRQWAQKQCLCCLCFLRSVAQTWRVTVLLTLPEQRFCADALSLQTAWVSPLLFACNLHVQVCVKLCTDILSCESCSSVSKWPSSSFSSNTVTASDMLKGLSKAENSEKYISSCCF